MEELSFITLRDNPSMKEASAEWFHRKWGVPKEAYLECMESYLENETEYGWYLCMENTDGICAWLEIKSSAEWVLLKMTFMTEKI